MGHPPRIFTPDVSLHVIRRGNNRGIIFGDDVDRHYFLRELRYAAEDHHVAVHGFVMMTTHYHLLVTPEEELSLQGMMKAVGEQYSCHFNRRHDRIGTLWAGRYRALPLEDERRWMTCLRYIEQNPWRARIVDTPEAYPWSSCRAHALGEMCEGLVPHRLYLALGSTPDERQVAYRAIVDEGLTDEELSFHRAGRPRKPGKPVSDTCLTPV